MSMNDLIVFLERDSLYVDNEEQVFDAVTRWIKNNYQAQKDFARLLQCVRCTRLPLLFLTEHVERCEWVKLSSDCLDLVNEAKFHLIHRSFHIPNDSALLSNKRWDSVSFKTFPRVCDAALRLIFAINDRHSQGDEDEFIETTLELYNPMTNTWSPRVRINHVEREGSRETWERIEVVDNKVYFLNKPSAEFETSCVFDMAANKWTTIPNMISTRYVMASGVIDGQMWKAISPMNKRRYQFSAAVSDGMIYVAGGNYPKLVV
ncbi:hypothetical protein PMAYCL1PPCAC_26636, partial [Pristionchus mayeri]